MTFTAVLVSRGRLFSRAWIERKRLISPCSAVVSRFATSTRNLSSVQPLLEEEEEQDHWTRPKPLLQASLPLLTSTASPSSVSQPQQHRNNDQEKHAAEESHVSPSELVFTGNHNIPITSTLKIVTPEEDAPRGIWPVFRMMDEDGHFRDPSLDGYEPVSESLTTSTTHSKCSSPQDLDILCSHIQELHPHFSQEFQHSSLLHPAPHEYPDVDVNIAINTLLRAYTHMMRLREMDVILQNAQRQGRISFYMTCLGEEAIHIGAASALTRDDTVLAQYREAGILMWRGFTLEQFTNQCFSNDHDLGKGRQMPVHYGSRALNYHTISSPLGTQLPQAVGVAYHAKLSHNHSVTACFFGDGCASTTDFHSACNFAATLQVPLLFVCRNNGYAISTPVSEQYAGDGIVARAPGYGMAGIRVDGNDLFAVHAAVQACKDYALKHSAPVLMELMTYRRGHHSTSDDSTRYRNLEEVHAHQHKGDPLKRIEGFLVDQDIVDTTWMMNVRDSEKMAVLRAMEQAERRPKPPLEELFQDVYHDQPPHLQRQEAQLRKHMAKYPQHYGES